MNKDYQKLEEELMAKESIQKVLTAVDSLKPQLNSVFAANLEDRLLQSFERKTSKNFIDSFNNFFRKRAFAYVTSFVLLVFLTYIFYPFGGKEFSPEGFLQNAYANYEDQKAILSEKGDINYTKILSQNGPDMKEYVADTAYPDGNVPDFYQIALTASEVGKNQIITETWRDIKGNYFTISIYKDSGEIISAYLQNEDGEIYNEDPMAEILNEYDDPEIQAIFKEQMFICVDEEGQSTVFNIDEVDYLEEMSEPKISNESVNTFSEEDKEYYQEFGGLYGNQFDRGPVLESLLKRENVNYEGVYEDGNTEYQVFSFNQPLPEEFGNEFETLTWLYFTEDYELIRQDVGVKVSNKEYKLQTVIYQEEDYLNDYSVFDPAKYNLKKAYSEPGCYNYYSGEKTSLSEIKKLSQ